MDYFIAVLMGILQGLTEFIPVSSTAHLRILPALLGQKDLGAAFTAVIQIGTLFSLLIYFRKDIYYLFVDFFKSIINKNYQNQNFLLSVYIIVGTLPIVVFGLLFKKYIENELRSLIIIATSLIVFAIVFLIAEIIGNRQKSLKDINLKDALLIGIAQAFALIPGASRSGVTICMGLLLGYRREESARFSFLLSIPSVFAAGVFEMKEIFKPDASFDLTSVIIALIVSFLSGILAIEFLLRFLTDHRLNIFAYYRMILGIAILLLFA